MAADGAHAMNGAKDQDVHKPERPAANVLFFARCPPTLSYEELLQLFSQYGEVKELNLYRRWAKAKSSKGCGTVTFKDKACAQAAMDALNGKQEWPESEAQMVVEWCVPEKLQIKPKNTEGNVTGTKWTLKPKSVAKCSKSLPLPKLLRGDQTASQGLLQEAWTHSLFDGYSSASDQDSPMPAHLVPMIAGMIPNLPAAAQCSSKPSFSASNVVVQLPNNLTTAHDTLLPTVAPPLRDCMDQNNLAATLSSLQNTFGGSCYNSSVTNLWSHDSNLDLQHGSSNSAAAVTWPTNAIQVLSHADSVWQQQQQQQAALAAAAVKGLASGLTSTRSSISGAASHSVPCNSFFNAPSICSVMDDGHASASLFCSTEYGYDQVSVSGGCAGPDMCTSVPQSSAALPSLMEVIPAMSWLQLQQMELQQQQSMMNASFAVANSSSPLSTVPEQYIAITAGMASAAVHAAAATAAAAPQLDEVRVDLNRQSLKLIAASINTVADVSGANVAIDALHGELQLRVSGSAAQVEAACNSLCFVLAQGGMEGISKSCQQIASKV